MPHLYPTSQLTSSVHEKRHAPDVPDPDLIIRTSGGVAQDLREIDFPGAVSLLYRVAWAQPR